MNVVWTDRARRDPRRLPPDQAVRVVEAVERWAGGDHGDVKKLRGGGGHRLRVGGWRIRFRVDRATATILHVLPRGNAYRP